MRNGGGESDCRELAATIRPIDKSVVHRICSGQVILDLSAAVKELVENSLDAGATTIEIFLKEQGQEFFKVSDNGFGISPDNFQTLARKHHTSKLVDFPDLQSLTTFGFRGEALSSLCALGNLTIETRTKNEPVGTHLTFDHSGLVTSERKTARQIGTTVTVDKLFSTLPVRSKEFGRNIRREYGKLISLLNAYALIAKGVRLICTNTNGKSKSVVLKTEGNSSLKDNIITVLGMSTFSCLVPLNLCISDSIRVEGFLSRPGYGNGRTSGDRQFFYVNSRPVEMPKVAKLINELYRSYNSRQLPIAIMNFTIPTKAYDVNVTPDKRKIFFSDESSLMLSLKEAMEGIYSPNQCSYSINKIEEPKKECDTIMLDAPDDDLLILSKPTSPQGTRLMEAEHDLLETADEISTPKVDVVKDSNVSEGTVCSGEEGSSLKDFNVCGNGSKRSIGFFDYQPKKLRTLSTPPALIGKGPVENASSARTKLIQSSLTRFVAQSKSKHESSCTVLSEFPVLRKEMAPCQVRKIRSEIHPAASRSLDCENILDNNTEANDGTPLEHIGTSNADDDNVETLLYDEHGDCGREPIKENAISQETVSPCRGSPVVISKALPDADQENTLKDMSIPSSLLESSNVIVDAPVPPNVEICSVLQFSIEDLKKRRSHGIRNLHDTYKRDRMMRKRSYAAATLDNFQLECDEVKEKALAAATSELERLFGKEDFARMKVIGQFNLGFIVGKVDQDLFIVDQHAADEKYNFERLSQSTIFNQQPLLQPMRLELSPEQEVVASLNMDIIRKNGFALIEDIEAPPGHHFLLKAVPFSKNITLGAEDVKELISTLADSQEECSIVSSYKMDTKDSICPSRVRSMLASRACRSSVMIGDPLGRNDMRKILEHLADLKSPWNCPHGRPTMRHLIDLTTVYKKYEQFL